MIDCIINPRSQICAKIESFSFDMRGMYGGDENVTRSTQWPILASCKALCNARFEPSFVHCGKNLTLNWDVPSESLSCVVILME